MLNIQSSTKRINDHPTSNKWEENEAPKLFFQLNTYVYAYISFHTQLPTSTQLYIYEVLI